MSPIRIARITRWVEQLILFSAAFGLAHFLTNGFSGMAPYLLLVLVVSIFARLLLWAFERGRYIG